MDIRPILSTLSRHKTAAGLIVLEVALTCAIICNAVFLIGTRLERIQRPSGVAESTLVRVQITGIGAGTDTMARTTEDLAALRAIPGVVAVASTNQTPLGQSSWNSSVRLKKDQDQASATSTLYMGTEGLLDTLGVRVVQGRAFLPEEYVDYGALEENRDAQLVSSVLITRNLAEKLFPGESAVGKTVYVLGDEPQQVVGVIDTLQRPSEWAGTPALAIPRCCPFGSATTSAAPT